MKKSGELRGAPASLNNPPRGGAFWQQNFSKTFFIAPKNFLEPPLPPTGRKSQLHSTQNDYSLLKTRYLQYFSTKFFFQNCAPPQHSILESQLHCTT